MTMVLVSSVCLSPCAARPRPARRDDLADAEERLDLVLLEQIGDAVDVARDVSSLCFIIAFQIELRLPTTTPRAASRWPASSNNSDA